MSHRQRQGKRDFLVGRLESVNQLFQDAGVVGHTDSQSKYQRGANYHVLERRLTALPVTHPARCSKANIFKVLHLNRSI